MLSQMLSQNRLWTRAANHFCWMSAEPLGVTLHRGSEGQPKKSLLVMWICKSTWDHICVLDALAKTIQHIGFCACKIYPTYRLFMALQNLSNTCVFYALAKSMRHMCFLCAYKVYPTYAFFMRLQNLSNIWVFMHLQNVSNIWFLFFMGLQNLSNRCVFSALAKSALWKAVLLDCLRRTTPFCPNVE